MSMYLSIGTTIAAMEDAYGTASTDVRLERIAGREPVATRLAEFLRRTARALLVTAAALDHERGSGVGQRVQTAT